MLFIVAVQWTREWAGGWTSAPADAPGSWVTVNHEFAPSSSLAFPVEPASVVAVPVESLVDSAVVIVRSVLSVFFPGLFLGLGVLVAEDIRESFPADLVVAHMWVLFVIMAHWNLSVSIVVS